MLTHETAVRLGAFITVFTAMALWEAAAPRRTRSYSRFKRWPSNLAVVALNTALIRILLPTTAVALAPLGAKRGWGLLNGFAVEGSCRFDRAARRRHLYAARDVSRDSLAVAGASDAPRRS